MEYISIGGEAHDRCMISDMQDDNQIRRRNLQIQMGALGFISITRSRQDIMKGISGRKEDRKSVV